MKSLAEDGQQEGVMGDVVLEGKQRGTIRCVVRRAAWLGTRLMAYIGQVRRDLLSCVDVQEARRWNRGAYPGNESVFPRPCCAARLR